LGAEWHYSKGDERLGPISTDELKAMAADGRLSPEDLIWREGQKDWVPARSAKGLFPVGGPPPLPKGDAAAPPPLPARAHHSRSGWAGRIPKWAYAAGGAGGILFLVAILAIVFRGSGKGSENNRSSEAKTRYGHTSSPRHEPRTSTPARSTEDLLVGIWHGRAEAGNGVTSEVMAWYFSNGKAQAKAWNTQGSVTTPAVIVEGTWSLSGDRLTEKYEGLPQAVSKVHSVNERKMIATDLNVNQTVTYSRIPQSKWDSVQAMTPAQLQAASQARLPPGVHDAELWARVQRECSALSDVEKLTTYQMLLIKKQSDQRMKASREMFAPIGQ